MTSLTAAFEISNGKFELPHSRHRYCAAAKWGPKGARNGPEGARKGPSRGPEAVRKGPGRGLEGALKGPGRGLEGKKKKRERKKSN